MYRFGTPADGIRGLRAAHTFVEDGSHPSLTHWRGLAARVLTNRIETRVAGAAIGASSLMIDRCLVDQRDMRGERGRLGPTHRAH